MQRAEARFAVQDGRVDIHTDLRRLDSCDHAAVLVGLGAHLGFEEAPLLKAIRRKPAAVDPRYPWLRTLIQQAHTAWDTWGDRLVKGVRRLLHQGQLLPMNRESEQALQQLFSEHAVGITLSFGGESSQQRTVDRLIKSGAIDPDYRDTALTTLGYKLGRGLDALSVHRVPADQSPSLASILEAAAKVQLTTQDNHAIDYARRRAGIYMRRPATECHQEIERQLTEAERWAIARSVEGAVRGRKGHAELARDLAAATKGTTLVNDMDRVARTELHFAHSHGAYVGLKQQASDAGDDDPLVYKLVRPSACHHCRRIWGPPADPTRYRLSTIEEREAGGANFRTPASQWGPTIGPVHPNCTEGALLYFHPDIHDAIQEAVDELADWYDQ